MKTIPIAILFLASSVAYAQKPCDELKGMEKEACLKKGGTVQASTAGAGSTAKKDYTKHDDKQREGG